MIEKNNSNKNDFGFSINEEQDNSNSSNSEDEDIVSAMQDEESLKSFLSEQVSSSIISTIYNISFNEYYPYEKGKYYPYAFEINEETIKKIDKFVCSYLSELNSISGDPKYLFSGQVRFPDLTTEQFDSLSQMLDEASNKDKDPERLSISWLVVLKEPMLAKVTIQVVFVTEQRLETEEMKFLSHYKAGMNLSVSGVSKEWVDKVFSTISPQLESSKLSGIYKPLLIFRNDSVVDYLSYALGGASYAVSFSILERFLDDPDYLLEILSQPTLEKQFEQYMEYVFTITPFLHTIIYVLIPLSILLIVPFLLIQILPRLVPKSVIAIGLTKIRFAKYQNAFKFLVFSILVTGIILPLIIGIIVNLLT